MTNSSIILPDAENLSLDVLAEMLNMDVEDIYDLTLEQLSDLTIQAAEEKTNKINQVLDNRNVVHTVITKAQEDYGVTRDDLSAIFFEEINQQGS